MQKFVMSVIANPIPTALYLRRQITNVYNAIVIPTFTVKYISNIAKFLIVKSM